MVFLRVGWVSGAVGYADSNRGLSGCNAFVNISKPIHLLHLFCMTRFVFVSAWGAIGLVLNKLACGTLASISLGRCTVISTRGPNSSSQYGLVCDYSPAYSGFCLYPNVLDRYTHTKDYPALVISPLNMSYILPRPRVLQIQVYSPEYCILSFIVF